MIKGYREKIESELAKICKDILDVLDKHLIPSAASGEFNHSHKFQRNQCYSQDSSISIESRER
jgi:hypothetical protein